MDIEIIKDKLTELRVYLLELDEDLEICLSSKN